VSSVQSNHAAARRVYVIRGFIGISADQQHRQLDVADSIHINAWLLRSAPLTNPERASPHYLCSATWPARALVWARMKRHEVVEKERHIGGPNGDYTPL
jgi:hypothetical protein